MDCVTWTKPLINTLEVFQNNAMRIMTGHTLLDHIPIKDLRTMTDLVPIEAHIRSKTLKLFGHIKRSSTGLSKLCVEGMIEGQRSRGAPKRRWRENVKDWSEINSWETINSTCKNRKQWKKLSCINTQSATFRRSAV